MNVVRECGRDIRCPDADAPRDGLGLEGLGEAAFAELVDRAFRFAAATVLEVLFREHQLLERLRSMKHYFFLDLGDLYVNFMDLAEEELNKEAARVPRDRVEALLSLAVSTSVANVDPFKEDVACAFAPYSMERHLDAIHGREGARETPAASDLKGVSAFMLDYKVSWYLSQGRMSADQIHSGRVAGEPGGLEAEHHQVSAHLPARVLCALRRALP